MKVEHFFLGLARRGVEIDFKGYRRQPVTFTPSGHGYGNAEQVKFERALSTWGVVDGFVLSDAAGGPVIAAGPFVVPHIVQAGTAFWFDVGTIWMTRESIEAIKNRKPTSIAS